MSQNVQTVSCDVLVVGGGINGVGIARDLAGRGLDVILCEKDDLASHTSSASTKLIHGGLRYLEQYEFGLVRKALIEREVLLRAAPHIMRPLRFVMPHDAGQRPAWMIRAGMFLYDHLARRELLPASRTLDLRTHRTGKPLHHGFERGFSYSDGWVDDARLVVLNALSAAEHGARVLTRSECIGLAPEGSAWSATLRQPDGAAHVVKARSVVNAAGPWVGRFAERAAGAPGKHAVRLVKGSHIVVRKLFEHDDAYIFQHPDGRIVFAIPYEEAFTLIGTTDVHYSGDLDRVAIDDAEIAYLCELSNHYFSRQIAPADVLWSYSGVRPLVDDQSGEASQVTRDYRLELNEKPAPMLSVYGGKITTYRKLAEQAADMLAPLLGNRRGPWTAGACLPGGDLFATKPENRAVRDFELFVARLRTRYPWLDRQLAWRYARSYGTRTDVMLRECRDEAGMGQELLPGLFEVEAAYLIRHEWAACAHDILWRRSKLGLRAAPGAAALLDQWIAQRAQVHPVLSQPPGAHIDGT